MDESEIHRQLACTPDEVAIKGYFLGPKAENGLWLKKQVQSLLSGWFDWRQRVFAHDGSAIGTDEVEEPAFSNQRMNFSRLVSELTVRFENEIPKFSPRYVGHMFSELSLPALIGHLIALLHNPNNISCESSRVGLELEREAAVLLLQMIGADPDRGTGHFTSGGTVANLEAIIRARYRLGLWQALGAFARLEKCSEITLMQASQMGWKEFDLLKSRLPNPDRFREWMGEHQGSEHFNGLIENAFGEERCEPAIIIGATAHYSWKKCPMMLGFPKESIIECPVNDNGQMDRQTLREGLEKCRAERRPVALVVSVAGTTEFGTVDRINQVSEELTGREQQGWFTWHHVDGAYGGFFASLRKLESDSILNGETLESLRSLARANSVTIDPHKLGYVPYACGAFLCGDRRDYPHHSISAPYIDFNPELDPGLHTLEGSRAATGAVATWLAGKTIGFDESGHGRVLLRATAASRDLVRRLSKSYPRSVFVPPGLDLNIVCFSLGNGIRLSQLNRSTGEFSDWIQSLGEDSFLVSKTTITIGSGRDFLGRWLRDREIEIDCDGIHLIRLCLMNPFLTSRRLNSDLLGEFEGRVGEYLARS